MNSSQYLCSKYGITFRFLGPNETTSPENIIRAVCGSNFAYQSGPNDILNVDQVAALLHVAPSTVRAIPAHELQYSLVASKRRLYFRRDVHEYLKSRRAIGIDTEHVDRNPLGLKSGDIVKGFDVDAAISSLRRKA